jgi:tripartite-type tricarboxylate transporter receptor subunit TctC
MFINQDVALPQVQAGKLRVLAVASVERNPAYPDTPTIAESGFPGFSAVSWFGLSAPASTPEPIIDTLNAEAVKALQNPEFKERMEKNGFVVVGSTPEEFTAFVAAETEKWGDVIEKGGIKAE